MKRQGFQQNFQRVPHGCPARIAARPAERGKAARPLALHALVVTPRYGTLPRK